MNQTQRLQRYFSPLLIAFIVIVVLLVSAVCYVAFSRTTITVTLNDIPATVPFQYSAAELGVEATTIPIETTYTFTDYEADSSEDAIARGTVTLINNYSGDQPLVRTTRILSESGVLFRIDEPVTVPAGGSIEVEAYADEAGASGNIAPTKFEIVALDDSLKDQIYAESAEPMTGGLIKKVTLTDELVAQAKAAAEAEAISAAEDTLAAEIELEDESTVNADNWQVTLTEQAIDGTVDTEVESIVVTTKGSATYLPIDTELIRTQVQADNELVTDGTITYSVTTDGNDWIVSGEAQTVATEPSLDFIDPASLTGKTEQQVKEYLADFEQVNSVTVRFVPFWIERTPKLPQQINLILNANE